MRRTTKIVATALLFLGALSFEAGAQTMSIGSWRAQALPNYSTPFKNAGCYGRTGYCGCGPGWISACSPRCCRCVPC